MSGAVQRSGADGLGALMRYGIVSAGIGVLTLVGFCYFAFVSQPALAKEATYAVAAGALAAWSALFLMFPAALGALKAQAATGWSQDLMARAMTGAALAGAGWVFLFLCALLGALSTDSFLWLGAPMEAVLIGAMILLFAPEAFIIVAVIFSVKGAQNAR
jgi:hypothetical protein